MPSEKSEPEASTTRARVVNKRVFLIHGRNLRAKEQFALFLTSLGLEPVSFVEQHADGPAMPPVLEVVKQGMDQCHLVVALFTPDEWSVLRGDMRKASDDEVEHRRWQSRQNVLFEAGLACGLDPSRVIFVQLGDAALFSDFRDRLRFTPTNRPEEGSPRHTLCVWLRNWFGKQGVHLPTTDDWKRAGDFETFVAPRARPIDALAAASAGQPWLEREAVDGVLASARRTRDILGDAITLAAWTSSRFLVHVDAPQDAVDFQGPFARENHGGTLTEWLRGYPDVVQEFVNEHIDAVGKSGLEQAKLGLVAFDAAAVAMQEIAIRLRPTNHLVTTAFNRALAMERLEAKSHGGPYHQLWVDRLREILGDLQSVHFQCPSQLFLELALVTRDGFVPSTQKIDHNSVYARRNGGRPLWTCGLELGPRWADAVTVTSLPNVCELDLAKVALRGLKKEYNLDLPETAASDQFLKIRSLALQTLHLNSAFLGYWLLPVTSDELRLACGGKVFGGLNHSRLYFTRFEDSDKRLVHEESTAWHGTAMARFKLLEDEQAAITSALSTRES